MLADSLNTGMTIETAGCGRASARSGCAPACSSCMAPQDLLERAGHVLDIPPPLPGLTRAAVEDAASALAELLRRHAACAGRRAATAGRRPAAAGGRAPPPLD